MYPIAPGQFVPTLLIGIGEKSHFYTLRMTHIVYVPGEGPYGNAIVNGVYQGKAYVSDHHLYNLAQNAQEAYAKAVADAAEMGLELRASVAGMQEQLEAIKRATADELEIRERAEIERREKYKAVCELNAARDLEVIEAGFFPGGKYQGMAFDDPEVDVGYINWFMVKVEEFEAGSLNRRIAEILVEFYPHLKLPVPDPVAVVGKIGQRMEFNVRVIRVYTFDGEYGRVCFATLVTNEGVCLMAKGGWFPKAGEQLKIKATVKKHDEFRGQAQTVVNRVKEI